VEANDTAGPGQGVTDVVEPENLAVGRVEERHTVAVTMERTVGHASGVAFRLC